MTFSAPELRKLQESQARASAVVNAKDLSVKKPGFSMDWLTNFFKRPEDAGQTVKWVEEGNAHPMEE